ncbi:MAG: 3-deoxy-D-manno-octulosonate 8-phosphate phosphatase KdsC [Thermodesulfobacterium sp.]|uniref:3-deoxy-D-manno-octulosonate 8-phosphate phosphatase KdsC n=1 Tax=Candidatus Thermodesulfobacterium syntrophicum TaxID=3060442 RepID=A0AAE3P3F1_9BACT|nr:3-deoxy-D-manno-octulosonate 8-phosphate phosphatase KdsC [Candidatus Thermodesulfobacterium syntrophicum]
MEYPESVLKKASKIKFLLLDVDGVLTDGRIIIDSQGNEIKNFNVLDGMGIKLLQKIGVEVGILSSRFSLVVKHRSKELGINVLIQGKLEKLNSYEKLLKEKNLKDEDVAYMGDDWVDLPILKRVGLAIGVPNAWYPINKYVDYVTKHPGGLGAVREVCDLILKAKGKWENLLKSYLA